MNNKNLNQLVDENLLKLGFLLGLGVRGFSEEDKEIIKICLNYKNDKTDGKYLKALLKMGGNEVCEDVVNTLGYWIEKDLSYSRVKGLKNPSSIKLSPLVESRLTIRYKARLRKEFRDLGKTAKNVRRITNLVAHHLFSDGIADEAKLLILINRLKVLSGSCDYKVLSGLLIMEMHRELPEDAIGLVYICFVSYMSESLQVMTECERKIESKELLTVVERYKEFLLSRLKKYRYIMTYFCDIDSKNAVKSVLLKVDDKAIVDDYWLDLKQNIEACRLVLAAISSKKLLIQES